MLDVDTIAARASRATEGPWITGDGTGGSNDGRIYKSHGWIVANTNGHEANADFIAAARQDVPDLVAEVRRLRGLLDEARSLVTHIAVLDASVPPDLPDDAVEYLELTIGDVRAARALLRML